jgi:hypothetical protein
MKRPVVKYIVLWIGLLGVGGNTISQNPEWMYWDPWSCLIPSRLLNAIEIDDESRKWIATEPVCGGGICTDGGLAVFDGYTWFVYDSINSTLNSNFIGSVHIDADNVVWAGTRYGEVSSYDGSWEVHPFPVSGNVPVVSLDSDLYGYIWAATEGNGLFVYDGSDWEQYSSSNSPLSDFLSSVAAGPDNSIWTGGATNKLFKYTGDWTTLDIPSGIYFISEIAVNHENSVWLGSEGVFCNYFAGNWTVYDESITGIPDTAVGYVFDIEFDYSGNTWIGHSKGLIKYDGSVWTTFSPDNSGLLSEHIQALRADELGNLWIGTADTGLIAYQQGGVVKVEERRARSESRINLLDPYPNPSKGTITIPFEVEESSYIRITVRDVFGRIVRNLFDGKSLAGSYSITFSLDTKGVYFINLVSNHEIYSRKLILH